MIVFLFMNNMTKQHEIESKLLTVENELAQKVLLFSSLFSLFSLLSSLLSSLSSLFSLSSRQLFFRCFFLLSFSFSFLFGFVCFCYYGYVIFLKESRDRMNQEQI